MLYRSMRGERTKSLYKATILLLLSFSAAKAGAGQLLNFQNPISEVGKYTAGGDAETPDEKLASRQKYQATLTASKKESMAMCQETYTGEEFINCQNKVDYAYLVLENIPNVIDRMEHQGVQSTELKVKAEKEARAMAFTFVKSAFKFETNNG